MKMKTTPQTNLTVLRNDVEWNTRFEGSISSIEIDGQKLSDIHDLARKVDYNTKVTKRIAWASIIAVAIALSFGVFITSWLLLNNGKIQRSLESDKRNSAYTILKSKGFRYENGAWLSN